MGHPFSCGCLKTAGASTSVPVVTPLRMTTLKAAVHDEGVDVALRGVVEGAWQTAHDFEAEFLPEADGLFICADDNIELHGAKASCSGVVERMGAHGAGDAATGG